MKALHCRQSNKNAVGSEPEESGPLEWPKLTRGSFLEYHRILPFLQKEKNLPFNGKPAFS